MYLITRDVDQRFFRTRLSVPLYQHTGSDMKASLILIIIVFLLFSAGCTPAQPAPDNTSQPTAAMTHTAESEATTPELTMAVPTVTTTQQPEATVTSPPPPADSPDPDQTKFDFSKYGPLAYIVDTMEHMFIRMMKPDGSLVDWEFEADKEFHINEIAWSADGSKLVLATTWDGINILSIADKNLINLSATNEFTITSSPSFSPDGKFITFFAFNEGAIYRINADGTGLVNLTPDARYRNSFESPAWSPSGEQIVYSRRFADGSIYLMNSDGSALRTLVDIGWNDQPRFSPDGRWLAFIRYNESQGFLYTMPLAGGSYRSFSSNQHDVISYSWSPDGRYLVFKDFNCDGFCYWMVEFATGEIWELNRPQDVFIFQTFQWSPLMMVAEKREDCTGGWTRLAIGNLIQLIGNVPNRVRSAPQKGENVVGQFVADETYILLDGPVCAEGLVWWEIADPRLPGGSGWTAEGDGQEYWLEPIK
jgi:WD40 repeat protein